MLYIKVMDSSNNIIAAEAHENPVYICRNRNGAMIRCEESRAQGILSLDESTSYQFDGKTSLGLDNGLVAYPIIMMEYEQIVNGQQHDEGTENTEGTGDTGGTADTEDTSPTVPEGTDESTILSRAELTAKVAALEDQLEAAKILLGVE